MNQADFINRHTSTPFYTACIDAVFLNITFLVRIPAALYTGFGHQGKFDKVKTSVLKVRLAPDLKARQTQFDQLDALLTKLHKKPNIKAMKLPTLRTTFVNACKTNDKKLIGEILTLPTASLFDYNFYRSAAFQCIQPRNFELFKQWFEKACFSCPQADLAKELAVDDMISEACAHDMPAVITYLVERFPDVDLHQEYDRFFYRAVYQKSWLSVAWFFENQVMTLTPEVENRITNKLTKEGKHTTDTIRHLRSISLKFKLDAELPYRDDDEEEDTPIVKI
ncbi:hypothetical protein [Paraburkholderia fungorum]|jgi:hypothetical protein|uniref:hypothetical protein n=1 Tax=Paraburkholderia fungorum TaxID=134537 RepID=UPI000D06A34F|nr:hypothetical protein [Paraburkholderia fungorum]PRZ45400.1 hypothetical protein BX589_13979 [Paraburkholderia fungorum]